MASWSLFGKEVCERVLRERKTGCEVLDLRARFV